MAEPRVDQPQSVAAATETLEHLQEQRQRLVERSAKLDSERRSAAYQAHVGHDAEAR